MEIIRSIVAMLPTQYARNKCITSQEIPMTEPRAPKNGYLVTVRGQLETATRIFVHSEDEARRNVVDDKWQWAYEPFEGEGGTVCEQLNRDMAMEIVKVEFIRELPPPPTTTRAVSRGDRVLLAQHVGDLRAQREGQLRRIEGSRLSRSCTPLC